jgi:hypothetical protein
MFDSISYSTTCSPFVYLWCLHTARVIGALRSESLKVKYGSGALLRGYIRSYIIARAKSRICEAKGARISQMFAVYYMQFNHPDTKPCHTEFRCNE